MPELLLLTFFTLAIIFIAPAIQKRKRTKPLDYPQVKTMIRKEKLHGEK